MSDNQKKENRNTKKDTLLKLLNTVQDRITEGCGFDGCKESFCASNFNNIIYGEEKDKKEVFVEAYSLMKKGIKPCSKWIPPKLEELPEIEYVEAEDILQMITEAKTSANYTPLIRYIGKVFSDSKRMEFAFAAKIEDFSGEKKNSVNHESYRHCSPSFPAIDFQAIDKVFNEINNDEEICDVFAGSIGRLIKNLPLAQSANQAFLFHLRKYLVLLECPHFIDPEYHSDFILLLKQINALNKEEQKQLIIWFSKYSSERLSRKLDYIHMFITIRWESKYFRREEIEWAVKFLDMINKASNHPLYSRKPFFKESLHIDNVNDDVEMETKNTQLNNQSLKKMDYTINWEGMLKRKKRVGDFYTVDGVQSHLPRSILRMEDFYNDAINSGADLKREYLDWVETKDPASKSRIMTLDAKAQMIDEEMKVNLLDILRGLRLPILILRIRRNNMIEDTLEHLKHCPREDLKKPLKVKFEGEQGVDEGGVRKEFFQLVVREVFEGGYDMFSYDEENKIYWFNKDSQSAEYPLQYELIGKILGLAIYNSVILDIHFPSFVYKKLMNEKITYEDFKNGFPDTAKSLETLLNYEGDVQEAFCRTFVWEYEVFGGTKTVELKENGLQIPLTNENRDEYVDRVIDYLVNTSVKRQFDYFSSGFNMVCGGEAIKLFRGEELELLICGSNELDFSALEEVCRYDGGYDENSQTIRNFWEVVHSMSVDEKKQLLAFATGSDRVPIKGLGTLMFVIGRNGPDTDRLPTAHTCFNHLLLPDYNTKEKLERLLKIAISNSVGFGLI